MAHRAPRRSRQALLVLALPLVLAACRVSYSFTGADIPKDARTVADTP